MKAQSKNTTAKIKNPFAKMSPEEIEVYIINHPGKKISFEQLYEKVKQSGPKEEKKKKR